MLVLLAGALGSFVHTTRSFVDSGATDGCVPAGGGGTSSATHRRGPGHRSVFCRARQRFASTSGATTVNPWGIVAVAALVGLFSKQATNKLDELFSTMFQTTGIWR